MRTNAKRGVQSAAMNSRKGAREEAEANDDVPLLVRRRTSSGGFADGLSAAVETGNTTAVLPPPHMAVLGPSVTYLEGFTYTRVECQPRVLEALHKMVPPIDLAQAKAYVQQSSGKAGMIELMDVSIILLLVLVLLYSAYLGRR